MRATFVILLSCLCPAAFERAAIADGDWIDYRRAGPFLIRAEIRLDRFESLLDELKEQRADIAATLSLPPSDSPIVVSLFRNRSSYSRFVAREVPEGKSRRALFVQGDGAGFIFLYHHSEFESDLRHEASHAILHGMLPFLPLWLDEGLAEYFEVPAAARASKNPHQFRMRVSSRFGWKPDLLNLEKKADLSQMTNGDYRESWAWVHFMLHGPDDANTLLKRYLATIHNHQPPGPLSQHLRRLYASPEARLKSHLKRWR